MTSSPYNLKNSEVFTTKMYHQNFFASSALEVQLNKTIFQPTKLVLFIHNIEIKIIQSTKNHLQH